MSDNWDQWDYFRRVARPLYAVAPDGRGADDPLKSFIAILVLGVFAAIGILGWQIYGYLRQGEWPALSVIAALQWLNIEWARSPRDWLGLHNLLDAMPLSLVVFFSGVVPISLWLWRNGREESKQPVDWGG